MTIYHNHHIIPRHAGGTDDPSNLIKLTIEEHAEAHRKLWEEHGRWQDYAAYMSLSNQVNKDELLEIVYRESGRMSSLTFEQHSEIAKNMWSKPGMREHLSEKRKEQNRMGNNPMKGKKQKKVCCIHCHKELYVHTLPRHQKSKKCKDSLFCF